MTTPYFPRHYGDTLPLYVAGHVSPEERAAIDRHLAECAACRRECDLWRTLPDALASLDSAPSSDLAIDETWSKLAPRLYDNAPQNGRTTFMSFTSDIPPQPPSQARATRTIATATVAAVLLVALAVGIFGFHSRAGGTTAGNAGQPYTQTPTSDVGGVTPTSAASTATPAPPVPTDVKLRATFAGTSVTDQTKVTVPSGTTVTLTVVPDHSLVPYQTFTMGIYAHDPYGFSELQYCTYPRTDTCSYVLTFSSAENTDYTKGTHTFTAFLGDIGGAIKQNSNDITITWS